MAGEYRRHIVGQHETVGRAALHRRDRDGWIAAPESNAPTHSLSNLEIGLAINAQYALDVDDHAVASKQHSETPKAKATTLCC